MKLLTHQVSAGVTRIVKTPGVRKRLSLSAIGKSVLKIVKFSGVGAAAGAIAGSNAAPSGGKRSGAREGAIMGAITGGVIASPGTAVAAMALPRKGVLVFRKIRGRIVPMRVK